MSKKPKLIVILGPTASGKSDLAIALARKFNGEIVSADSRQVYRGMDIGTGKVTKREQRLIPHHLLDIASPNKIYTVHHFQRDAKKAISKILRKGKLPLLCGGTGFWIEAVLSNASLPEVKPNPVLRKKLALSSTSELFTRLKKLDPKRAAMIDNHNPRRLIRALEIVMTTKKPVPRLTLNPRYDALIIGAKLPQRKLYRRIDVRLKKRLSQGMIAEVKRLIANGVPIKRLIDLGLEYRFVTNYLLKKLSRQELEIQLAQAIHNYAKRQITWFRGMEQHDIQIKWITEGSRAEKLIANFLEK